MISLLSEKVTARGWLTEAEFMNFVAVSEATPGPIAINMATFVGSSQGGIVGALCATLGAVAPSFLIVLLIAALIRNLLEYRGVSAFLSGVRPCVIGLILGTALTMMLGNLLGYSAEQHMFSPDLFAVCLFIALPVFTAIWKKLRGSALSPILLLVLCGCVGIGVFSI